MEMNRRDVFLPVIHLGLYVLLDATIACWFRVEESR